MEENDVKSTCGGTRLEFKIEKDENFLFLNLTQGKNFIKNLKRRKKLFFKIWRVVLFSIQSLTRNEFFSSKSCFLKSTKKAKYVNFTG